MKILLLKFQLTSKKFVLLHYTFKHIFVVTESSESMKSTL